MDINYLWDTNIVIYYLQKHFPPSAEQFIDHLFKESQPAISLITEIELLCWKTPSQKDLELLHSFIDKVWVFGLENAIKHQTAALRKQHNIKLPDAIIAATALSYDLTLITRNVADFKSIPSIKLINPYQLPTSQ